MDKLAESNKKELNILFLVSIFVFIVLILIAGCKEKLPTGTVCHEKDCFTVEIVSTPETRAKGLMYRTEMEEDSGMFFVFEERSVYPFWMKNTLIPLDMIWLDSKLRVVYIAHDVQPCKADPCPVVDPGVEARYVLELNGGTAARIGLKVGDSLTPDSSILAGADYI